MSSFVDSAEFERLLERIASDDASLTFVDLDGKGIGVAGAIRLAEALRGNTHIFSLGLWGNNIGDDGGRALASALQHNSTVTCIDLVNNINIGDEGGRAFLEVLQINSSITYLNLEDNDIDEDLVTKIEELVKINEDAPNPEEAHRSKIEVRVRWMLDSEVGSEYEAAVSLAMDELGSFPEAERRQGLFERLLGSAERRVDVAASVDTARGRALYWYAAECGAAPVVLLNILRAHPSLCACRDVRHKLYPFMLVATLPEARPGDVMEALLLSPSLVEGGISRTDV